MSHTLTTPTKPTASATHPPPAEKVRCKCAHLAKRLTSRSEKNPGRVFYQCYKGRDDPETCKFFVWEDMVPGKEPSTETKPTGTSPGARYNATLAAKASPIPKLGNYVKTSSSREGYTYTLPGPSPLKPITSIPHPPHPAIDNLRTKPSPSRLATTQDEHTLVRALHGRARDESLSDDDDEISGHEHASTAGEPSPESIDAFESAPLRRNERVQPSRRTDAFDDDDDDDGIAWAHVDADEIEARASQALAETPRPMGDHLTRDTPRAVPSVAQLKTPGATFIDRLKAVSTAQTDGPVSKKRKRDPWEDEHTSATGNVTSAPSMVDASSTTSWVSACGTLTPPETERRRALGAFSSATEDLQGSTSAISITSVLPGNGATSVHPLLEALNKDLVRRDRKVAADEKGRAMLRGRVKALEGRVRELEAELRRVKSAR